MLLANKYNRCNLNSSATVSSMKKDKWLFAQSCYLNNEPKEFTLYKQTFGEKQYPSTTTKLLTSNN